MEQMLRADLQSIESTQGTERGQDVNPVDNGVAQAVGHEFDRLLSPGGRVTVRQR
jgi:hypothetical protein